MDGGERRQGQCDAQAGDGTVPLPRIGTWNNAIECTSPSGSCSAPVQSVSSQFSQRSMR